MNHLTRYEPETLADAERLADKLSKSGLVPDALRGKPQDILVVIMTGHELGLSVMQSLRGLSIFNGLTIMKADLAVGLVKDKPSCGFFRLIESTERSATYETERKGEGKTRMTYTIQQAEAAGLAGKGPWRLHPAAMLRARCSLALARTVYPDILMGIYDPDEIPQAPQPSSAPVELNAVPVPKETKELQPVEEASLITIDAAPAQPAPSAEDALIAELVAAVHSANTLRDLRATGARIAASKLGNRPSLRDAYTVRQRDLRQQK